MNVERITITHVRIPLIEPFRISNGTVSEKDGIIIGVYADGAIGYGEASPMAGAFYSDETPESTWDCLVQEIIPRVQVRHPESVEQINQVVSAIKGNAFAKAGIETAYWDLEAQQAQQPLYQRLGGERTCVDSGLAVGIYPSVSELLSAITRSMADGYKRLKIKIQPGWDIEPLSVLRKEYPSMNLMVDANCAYTQADIGHLHRLDEFGLMMIEQPLPKDDLEGHAKLQEKISTPVCLDESAKDSNTVRDALAMKACKIVNIKIQRVGGLQNAKEIHDLCAEAGVPVWGGTMPELGIGGAQTVHLATLPNFTYPTDVEASHRWFVDDIIDPLLEVRNGCIEIPSGIGNCYQLKSSVMRRYFVREQEFSLS
ncbi:MAG: o-succinylbenzoate synthase [bacterium]